MKVGDTVTWEPWGTGVVVAIHGEWAWVEEGKPGTPHTYRLADLTPYVDRSEPDWVAAKIGTDWWVNVYSGERVAGPGGCWYLDDIATAHRIGRKNIVTGEWVPCDGRQVLS